MGDRFKSVPSYSAGLPGNNSVSDPPDTSVMLHSAVAPPWFSLRLLVERKSSLRDNFGLRLNIRLILMDKPDACPVAGSRASSSAPVCLILLFAYWGQDGY
jgi:hypothetical protein